MGHLTGWLPPRDDDFLDPNGEQQSRQLRVDLIDLSRRMRSCCGLAELFGSSQPSRLAMTDFSAFAVKLLGKYDSHDLVDLSVEDVDMFRLVRFKNFYAICTDWDETSCLVSNSSSRKSQSRNQHHNLYVCDMDLNRVLIYDLENQKLKKILTGKSFKMYRFIYI